MVRRSSSMMESGFIKAKVYNNFITNRVNKEPGNVSKPKSLDFCLENEEAEFNGFFERQMEDMDLIILEKEIGQKDKGKLKTQESARLAGIKSRLPLSSADGRTLDDHDQFYKDHKLLLVLFLIMGVMPIQRGEIGKITFKWCSFATIYAGIFYIFTSVLVVVIGYERLQLLSSMEKRFDEYIYAIIFVVFLIPHFWIPFVGWGVAREVTVYKNSWTHYQLRYYRITGKNLEFPNLQTLIAVISIACLGFALAFLWALSTLLEGFSPWHTCAYYHIITMINMNCSLWYINCRAICDASNALADSFQGEINKRCAPYIIAYYRHLWLALSEILQRLGNAYARTYSTYSLFMFVNITIALYGFLSEVIDNGVRLTFKELGLMVDATYCLILLFIFCDCAYNASEAVTARIRAVIFSIDMKSIESAAVDEIQLFLRAIEMNPPRVSLKGYAVVSRSYFTSMITSMALYMIVLVQFKVSFSNAKKSTTN